MEAELLVVVRADPLGRVDRAALEREKISPPARSCTDTPSRLITSPPMPGMRMRSPRRSLSDPIGRRNQPPICTPVLPHGKLMIPKSA